MSFDALLVQRAALQRGTVVRSATGEEVIAWGTEQSNLPVLVRPIPSRADLRPGETEDVTHTIFARPIPTVLDEPRARWRMLVDGREYVFVDPQDAAARGHHMEIRARRLS